MKVKRWEELSPEERRTVIRSLFAGPIAEILKPVMIAVGSQAAQVEVLDILHSEIQAGAERLRLDLEDQEGETSEEVVLFDAS